MPRVMPRRCSWSSDGPVAALHTTSWWDGGYRILARRPRAMTEAILRPSLTPASYTIRTELQGFKTVVQARFAC
jgi:hypothetical protein